MGEGFRLDDLRRWKKGDYVNKQPLGAYVTGASQEFESNGWCRC